MSTFVLVHGAWHGAWCWYKVISLLEKKGHRVITIDLPSHGRDKTPAENVTLCDYVNCVTRVLDEEKEPVILVGHSMGGIVISSVAEERPEKIKKLIYLSAFLLQDGETLLGMLGNDTLVIKNLVMHEGGTFTVKDEALKEVFYADCPETDVVLAKQALVPQPPEPFNAEMHLTEDRFGRVPRSYISCTKDNAIFPSVHKKMLQNLPCEQVLQMDTCHSSFFSKPELLVDNLCKLI